MTIKPERRPRLDENKRLRARLAEVEETLRAIRSGEVDALVVETAGENRIFTLHGADQTYRLMVEQMQKGAATLSQDGLVLYCNPFLAALIGLPLERVLGAPIFHFLDPPTGAFFGGLLKSAAHGVSRGEISFLRGEGLVLTQVSITVLTLDGTVVYCMIVTDLTERKRREEERLQLEHEQVARAAAEDANRAAQVEIERRKRIEESLLLAEMDRSQLLVRERMARAEAEEANRLKDDFLATLSHELRTPLSAILTWSHVLRQPGLDSRIVARAVDAIDRNARAQSGLVADLLDVSRIVTGNFHMDLAPVRLADVIESAADTMRPAARIKEIRLDVTLDPWSDLVLGDAGRLQQVVWNLLSNAIRMTPAGGRVQVVVKNAASGIELLVIDDGAGIDPDFLPHVFDRFRQADSSSTRRHAGLGLGLAIVRHLVELHGGSVEAHNRTERPGALFVVRLPRSLDPEPVASPLEDDGSLDGSSSPAGDPSLSGVSLLLVDDEEDSREAMAIALRQYGARVATSSSAAEARAHFSNERPQAIVADIGMPGEDGHALLRGLRLLSPDHGGGTPAIALTAYASPHDRQEALRSGFQMHVAKPVSPRDLAIALSDLLSGVRPQVRGPGVPVTG